MSCPRSPSCWRGRRCLPVRTACAPPLAQPHHEETWLHARGVCEESITKASAERFLEMTKHRHFPPTRREPDCFGHIPISRYSFRVRAVGYPSNHVARSVCYQERANFSPRSISSKTPISLHLGILVVRVSKTSGCDREELYNNRLTMSLLLSKLVTAIHEFRGKLKSADDLWCIS